jgi:hypothetical protein
MQKLLYTVVAIISFLSLSSAVYGQQAQPDNLFEPDAPATDDADIASRSAEEQEQIQRIREDDVTRVEEEEERRERIAALLRNRPIESPNLINFLAYSVQYSVREAGVPVNTVVLILLLPILATAVVFFRHVVGVPSLAMLLPVALSITLVATGLAVGLILLATIILTSTVARVILKKIRIMQFAKMALTIFIVSIGILATLTLSSLLGIVAVTQISIFPVLLLILLSQNIIELQIDRTATDMIMISAITVSLGILGYFLLSYEPIRNFVLLYPEIILLHIPINILIGRYFGLRFTEYFRFAPISQHHGR